MIEDLVEHARPDNWDDPDEQFLDQTLAQRDAWLAAERAVTRVASRLAPSLVKTGGILFDKDRVVAAMRRRGHEILTGNELARQLGQEVEKDAAL